MRKALLCWLLFTAPLEVLCDAKTLRPPSQEAWKFLASIQGDSPGISAAVSRHGETLFSGGLGYANLEQFSPMTGRSVVNIGSTSKAIAVVALMQLVERGKVSLSADIQTYVPWFPRKPWPITVWQVLTHTSGLRHYLPEGNGPNDDILPFRHYAAFETSTRFWRDDPLLFQPGTQFLYSSFATALIQGIVESASGLGFEDYLRRNVWYPAAMKSTQFDVPDRVVVGRADGYERENGGTTPFRRVLQEDVSYKYASGGMISTVDDLCRFGEALLAGRLLSEATRTVMWTATFTPSTFAMPQYNAHDKEHPYTEPEIDGIFEQALVWRIAADKRGRAFIYHPGEVKGTLTQLIIYPKEGLVVALQYNTETLGPKRFPRFDALAFANLFLE